jgi:hypothetical protein
MRPSHFPSAVRSESNLGYICGVTGSSYRSTAGSQALSLSYTFYESQKSQIAIKTGVTSRFLVQIATVTLRCKSIHGGRRDCGDSSAETADKSLPKAASARCATRRRGFRSLVRHGVVSLPQKADRATKRRSTVAGIALLIWHRSLSDSSLKRNRHRSSGLLSLRRILCLLYPARRSSPYLPSLISIEAHMKPCTSMRECGISLRFCNSSSTRSANS